MAQVVTDILSVNNPLFRVYAFYCSILVLKMMFMSVLTSYKRMTTKAFENPEDLAFLNGKLRTDESVERVRRAHLNDLEGIPIFFVVSLIYILTNPSYFFATTLFRVFTITRTIHTIVYAVVVIPQPARGISWFFGFAITGYMALHNVSYFLR
ncbi:hypothetical protein NQ315_007061 [Exocentrus adspersus]|uniref:Microsomal glutathione S-transferase 1 n=1 Tax=Exocentrus adspersus TaxID=1586481 RepID=A0AAV8WCL8_9CUCU|nr:hypothetical protein NQ315_007061 [Exocentrus adspersus]